MKMLWIKTFVGLIFQAAILALLLYLPAWTLFWEDALVWFLVNYSIIILACVYLLIVKPKSLEARLNMETEEQPKADKLATILMVGALIVGLVLCPIDVFHLQLTPSFTGSIKFFGLILNIIGILFIIISMSANEFAEPTVHIQKNRGQKAISSGIYAYIRHPMYTGFLFYMVGTNIWLGTYLSLIVASILLFIGLYFRISIEEKTLKNGLEGYLEYSEKVKARLIPFIF